MSIKVMSFVWDNSAAEGTALLMLLAIADHANDEGVCWPSVARLAQRARVKERQAQKLIAHLEAIGEIEIDRGAGRGHTSLYIIKGAAEYTLSARQKVQPSTPIERRKGALQREKVHSSAEKVSYSTPGTVIEPSLEPSVKESEDNTKPIRPPTPALAKHKAVVIYENLVRFPPDNISEQAITATVGADEPSLKKWGDTVTKWLMSGYRGNNVRGMLDWYTTGIPQHRNGNGKAAEVENTHKWDNTLVAGRVYEPTDLSTITF